MGQDRREFFKGVAAAGIVFLCHPRSAFASELPHESQRKIEINYQYRTISIAHLREAQAVLDRLTRNGTISSQKTVQRYLKHLQYEPPQELPNARSLILVATPWKLRSLGVRWNGKDALLLIPGGYFDYEDELFGEALKERVAHDVLGHSGGKLVYANPPLKTMAVRSGLAEYGRNNIAYVDGYGSFHVLWAWFTDQELPDQWGRPYRTMRLCKGCSICTRSCPTKAFSESKFVLDAGKCISTYNETKEPIPDWIAPTAHNALIGCLRCQFDCPANRELVRDFVHVADLTESETDLLLNGRHDSTLEASVAERLKGLGEWYAKDMKYLARNLRLAIGNSPSFEVMR